MIYLFVFLALAFFAIAHDFMNVRTGRGLSYFCAYLILVSLAAFRYKVGGDTYNYMYVHEFLPDLSHLFSAEVGIAKLQPLWLLLTAIAKSIDEEFYVMQGLQALLVNAAIFVFIKQNTNYRHTAILFYYAALYPYFNFEILRESLAISCFLMSVKHYNASRWGAYYFFVVLAFLFHVSAIVMLFLPLIKSLQIKPYFGLVVFLVSAMLNPVFSSLLSIPLISSILGYAASYITYDYTLLGLVTLFLYFALFPAVMFNWAKCALKIDVGYYKIANNGMLIMSCIPLLNIFFRFYNYFAIFFLLLAVEILHKVFRSNRSFSLRAINAPLLIVVFLLFYSSRYFVDTSHRASETRWYSYWFPYYSVFDPEVDVDRERLVYASKVENP